MMKSDDGLDSLYELGIRELVYDEDAKCFVDATDF